MVPESSSSPARARVERAAGQLLGGVRTRPYLLSLAAVLLVTVLARTYVYGAVFRGDDVLLLANDPYHYRFAVEGHVADSDGLLSLLRYTERDPMLVVGLSLLVALAGPEHAGAVLAWYPVVAGAVTVLLVAAVGRLVSGSRLVGLVAAVTLALSPVHVSRTALGFADHHAADYLWITATALVLLSLVAVSRRTVWRPDDLSDPVAWLAVLRWPVLASLLSGVLAALLATLVLSWIAGPLFVVPAALVVIGWATAADRAGWLASLWAAVAFPVAAVLVAAAHAVAGWQLVGVVAVTTLLAVIVVGVVAAVSVLRLLHVPWWARSVVAVGLVGFGVDRSLQVPAVRELFLVGREWVGSLEGTTIVEAVSIVGGPFGVVTGPLSTFGVSAFLAAAVLVVVSVAALRYRDAGVVLLAAYSWYFLAGALVQRRFAGELSPFAAVLVALGVVALARRAGVVTAPAFTTRLDLGVPWARLRREPTVDRAVAGVDRLLPVAFALLLVLMAVSSSGFLAVRMNQSVVTDAEYDAALALRADAVANGLTYPESYVLASVGDVRRYNYIVGGDDVSEVSMDYAAANYAQFLHSQAPANQYLKHEGRVGYVVTTRERTVEFAPESTYVRLHERLGSAGDGVDGAGQYRLVYADSAGTVRAFALVPGAILTGTAEPGALVTLSTPVTVGETSFTYRRVAVADRGGRYAVRVPYAGTYSAGNRAVDVTADDVREGRVVGARVVDETARVYSFDGIHDGTVLDAAGGTAGVVRGPTPTDQGLRFVGNGNVTIEGLPATGDGGFVVGVHFEDVEAVTTDNAERRQFNSLVGGSPTGYAALAGFDVGLDGGNVSGAIGDGDDRLVLGGPAVDDDREHEVLLWWNGSVAALVVDGEIVDSGRYTGEVSTPDRLAVGSTLSGDNRLYGVVNEVRYTLVPPTAETPPEELKDIGPRERE